MQYIAVTEGSDDDAVELPLEEDSTLLHSTLIAQFPTATGLRYKVEGSKAMRGLRSESGKLFEPPECWSQYIYHVVSPKPETSKRKIDSVSAREDGYGKAKRFGQTPVDLVVLGLPYSTTVEELREYFGQFGELVVSEIKRDKDGNSKGFGFIRYTDYETQMRVLTQQHELGEKKLDVKIPSAKGLHQFDQQKIFVGRLSPDVTSEALRQYFSQYCTVLDVFIPQPHRGFGYVTLSDPGVAEQFYGEDVVIDGYRVHIEMAQRRPPKGNPNAEMSGDGGMSSGAPTSYGMYEGGAWSYAPKQRRIGFSASDGYGSGVIKPGINQEVYQAAHAALLTALSSPGEGGQPPDFGAPLGRSFVRGARDLW